MILISFVFVRRAFSIVVIHCSLLSVIMQLGISGDCYRSQPFLHVPTEKRLNSLSNSIICSLVCILYSVLVVCVLWTPRRFQRAIFISMMSTRATDLFAVSFWLDRFMASLKEGAPNGKHQRWIGELTEAVKIFINFFFWNDEDEDEHIWKHWNNFIWLVTMKWVWLKCFWKQSNRFTSLWIIILI